LKLEKVLSQNRGFIAGVIAILFIRAFFYSHNIVPSGSMMPLTMPGDVLTTNKLAYHLKIPYTNKVIARWNEPDVGEVITFYENHSDLYMIKRVIAKEGDVVKYENRNFYVNGVVLPRVKRESEGFDVERMVKQSNTVSDYYFFDETVNGVTYATSYSLFNENVKKDFLEYLFTNFTYTVPKDSFFVVGDNRNQSLDSRYFAAIHRDQVVGRAHLVLFNYKLNNNRFFYNVN
jgi:signal peptidase I